MMLVDAGGHSRAQAWLCSSVAWAWKVHCKHFIPAQVPQLRWSWPVYGFWSLQCARCKFNPGVKDLSREYIMVYTIMVLVAY